MDNIKKNLNEIKGDIKEISSSLKEIDKTLVKQEAQLTEHIRRTNLLENKMEPVEKHVYMVNGALKFIGVVAVLLGIIATVISFFS